MKLDSETLWPLLKKSYVRAWEKYCERLEVDSVEYYQKLLDGEL